MSSPRDLSPAAAAPPDIDHDRVYERVHLLSAVALGAWQASYSWFLYTVFHFSAEEIALVIGAQLLTQIIVEIPSGSLAVRLSPRRLLLASFSAMALYCLFFLAAAVINAPAGSLRGVPHPHPLSDRHGITFVIALVGEVFFGIGSALLSGTVEAWRGDSARELAGTDSDYRRRLDAIASTKLVYGGIVRASVGGLAFWAATSGRNGLFIPWLSAIAVYLVTIAYVARYAPRQPRDSETPHNSDSWYREALENIGREAHRATSYLRESRSTLRLFLQTSLIHVLFWATQAFWIVLAVEGLGLGRDASLIAGKRALSYYVVIWVAGELASAVGAQILGRVAALMRAYSIAGWTLLYAAGLAVQLFGVTRGGPSGLSLLACGYVANRLLEGELKREMEVLTERAVVSERSTHQSIQSFFKAVAGLCVIAAAGHLINSDAVNGYAFLILCALIAAALFAHVPFDDEKLGVASLDEKPSPMWRNPRMRAVLACAAVLVITFVALSLDSRGGRLWASINKQRTVEIAHVSTDAVLPNAAVASKARPLSFAVVDGWELRTNEENVRCRTISSRRVGALGVSVEGAETALLHHDDLGEWLDFALVPKQTALVAAPTKIDRPFRCYIVGGPPATVIPTRVTGLVTERGEDDVWLLLELLAGAGVVSLFLWAGNGRSLRLLTDAQRLAPVASTLKFAGDERSTAIHPRRFLESLSERAAGLVDFTTELRTSNLLVGAFLLHEKTAIDTWAVHYVRPRDGGPIKTSAHQPPWLHRLLGGVVNETILRREREVTFTIPVRSLPPAKSSRISEWPIDWEPVVGSLPPSHDNSDGTVSVGISNADLGKDQLIGFAIAFHPREAVSRYVDPIERMLLRMLADVGQTQHRAALFRFESYTKFHDVGRWMGRILRRLDPLARSPNLAPDVEEALFQLHALVQSDAENVLVLMGRSSPETASFNLHQRLTADFAMIAGATRTKFGGIVRLPLTWTGSEVTLPGEDWLDVRRVVHELIDNASRHACSLDEPDVEIFVDVAISDGSAQLAFRNKVITAGRMKTIAPGLGIVNARTAIQRMHGHWIAHGTVGNEFIVEFSIPAAEIANDG
jgi:hypothetical protein